MSRLIYCVKLKKKTYGLDFLPFKGKLGERIYYNVSKEVWYSWLKYQIILINENNLSLFDIKSKKFLINAMKVFLFKK